MAITKTPFFGLGSSGSIGGVLTSQRGRGTTIIRRKPIPTDPQTWPQLRHRQLYRVITQYWNGLTLTEKRTWHTRASSLNLTGMNLFIREKLPFLSDLVGYWPLNEHIGPIAKDYSGADLHGTIYGATPTPGAFDYALDFDGLNDFVTLPNVAALRPAAFTLLISAKSTLANRYPLFGWGTATYSLIYYRWDPPKIMMYMGLNNFRQWSYTVPSSLSSAYHRLVFTIPGSYKAAIEEAQFFADGIIRTPISTLSTGTQSAKGQPRIGGGISRWYKGYQDEVMLFPRVLTDAEILLDANRKELQ